LASFPLFCTKTSLFPKNNVTGPSIANNFFQLFQDNSKIRSTLSIETEKRQFFTIQRKLEKTKGTVDESYYCRIVFFRKWTDCAAEVVGELEF
jgi:hypothetical protein